MPSSTYCICTTPRSGSNLLMFTLKQQGIGLPDEYFNHNRIDLKWYLEQHFNIVLDKDAFIRGLERFPNEPELLRQHTVNLQKNRLSDNGIFGSKIFAGDLLLDTENWKLVYTTLSPKPRIIHLIRDNLVEQAVSYYVAANKNEWFLDRDNSLSEMNAIPYDYKVIRRIVKTLKQGNEFWNQVLDHTESNTLRVTYTQLSTDFTGSIQQINAFLGFAGIPVPEPPIRKQTDPIKEQLISMFMEDVRRKMKRK